MGKFDQSMQEAIELFARGDYDLGVEAMSDLFADWTRAGMPAEKFNDLGKYIEDQSARKSDLRFVREGIQAARHRAYEKKRGKVFIPTTGRPH